MKILKFKTNIKSENDVIKVASILNKEENITNWNIDTDTEDNILSISGENLNPQKVENAVEQVGYKAEILRVLGIGGEGL